MNLRKEIAKLEGWTDLTDISRLGMTIPLMGREPNSKSNMLVFVPAYEKDLNAMARLERKLAPHEVDVYIQLLRLKNESYFFASAEERAEAYYELRNGLS